MKMIRRSKPTKPIGRFMTKEEAEQLVKEKYTSDGRCWPWLSPSRRFS